jgi:hypothetical protein
MRTTRSASFGIVFSFIFLGHVVCPIRWCGSGSLGLWGLGLGPRLAPFLSPATIGWRMTAILKIFFIPPFYIMAQLGFLRGSGVEFDIPVLGYIMYPVAALHDGTLRNAPMLLFRFPRLHLWAGMDCDAIYASALVARP